MTKIAMVSRWGVPCGIDNYVRELTEATGEGLTFVILANRERLATDADSVPVKRDWDADSADADEVIDDLRAEKPDVVHIQFNWGCMKLGLVRCILDYCDANGVPCVLQLHATYDHETEGTLGDGVPNMSAAAALIVHGDADARRLRQLGLDEIVVRWRLGEKVWPARDADTVRECLGITGKRPVVATFGFLQPRKRTLETIRALSIVRRAYPDAFLVAATALHPRGFDVEYYLACRDEIHRSGSADSVSLSTRYLREGAAMLLLQAADVIVLPYEGTPEGTSAAAKFCSAAGRPLVVSGESLFDDYRDSAYTLETTGADAIADAVVRIFEDPALAASLSERAKSMAARMSWEIVGREYESLIERVVADSGR
jgi:glycosyltransferase involved in cell wall biosynthesis